MTPRIEIQKTKEGYDVLLWDDEIDSGTYGTKYILLGKVLGKAVQLENCRALILSQP